MFDWMWIDAIHRGDAPEFTHGALRCRRCLFAERG
jgi:hypothetical protein